MVCGCVRGVCVRVYAKKSDIQRDTYSSFYRFLSVSHSPFASHHTTM